MFGYIIRFHNSHRCLYIYVPGSVHESLNDRQWGLPELIISMCDTFTKVELKALSQVGMCAVETRIARRMSGLQVFVDTETVLGPKFFRISSEYDSRVSWFDAHPTSVHCDPGNVLMAAYLKRLRERLRDDPPLFQRLEFKIGHLNEESLGDRLEATLAVACRWLPRGDILEDDEREHSTKARKLYHDPRLADMPVVSDSVLCKKLVKHLDDYFNDVLEMELHVPQDIACKK